MTSYIKLRALKLLLIVILQALVLVDVDCNRIQ
jgi:hypothetical protein